jgi:hypothetical protein
VAIGFLAVVEVAGVDVVMGALPAVVTDRW